MSLWWSALTRRLWKYTVERHWFGWLYQRPFAICFEHSRSWARSIDTNRISWYASYLGAMIDINYTRMSAYNNDKWQLFRVRATSVVDLAVVSFGIASVLLGGGYGSLQVYPAPYISPGGNGRVSNCATIASYGEQAA